MITMDDFIKGLSNIFENLEIIETDETITLLIKTDSENEELIDEIELNKYSKEIAIID